MNTGLHMNRLVCESCRCYWISWIMITLMSSSPWRVELGHQHANNCVKHFLVKFLKCREFTGHRWIPLTKASGAELWYFLWSPPEQTGELTLKTRVISDAIVLIMTSLYEDFEYPFSDQVMWIKGTGEIWINNEVPVSNTYLNVTFVTLSITQIILDIAHLQFYSNITQLFCCSMLTKDNP